MPAPCSPVAGVVLLKLRDVPESSSIPPSMYQTAAKVPVKVAEVEWDGNKNIP